MSIFNNFADTFLGFIKYFKHFFSFIPPSFLAIIITILVATVVLAVKRVFIS